MVGDSGRRATSAAELRPRAFALIFWALNLGFAVATLVGGFLADHGYWLLFAGDAATSAGFALIVARMVPETRPDRSVGDPGSLREVLRDRLMVALVLRVTLQSLADTQAFYTLQLAIVHDGLGTKGYGQVIAVNDVLIVLLQPLLLGALGASFGISASGAQPGHADPAAPRRADAVDGLPGLQRGGRGRAAGGVERCGEEGRGIDAAGHRSAPSCQRRELPTVR
ncbi:MAG: hypothetical protein NVS3B26_04920 [Mycobacteriales bacterium]